MSAKVKQIMICGKGLVIVRKGSPSGNCSVQQIPKERKKIKTKVMHLSCEMLPISVITAISECSLSFYKNDFLSFAALNRTRYEQQGPSARSKTVQELLDIASFSQPAYNRRKAHEAGHSSRWGHEIVTIIIE